MRTMSDDEVLGRAAQLKKRHRSEWCRLVYEASVGRSMQKIADLLGFSRQSIQTHLDQYALESAAGGGNDHCPLERGGANRDNRAQVAEVIRSHAPAEPDENYVAEYVTEGHTPEVAKRLARVYEATENAIEAGVVQESKGKSDERLTKIVLPQGTDWVMRLRRACADVKSAAGMLDRAKITDLKRAATRNQVAVAHAKWMEQIERLENFHDTFKEEVLNHEA
ncbi:hypothetical protein LCGC14_1289670 [marine sediment metagenome]|uniref:Uncharacterized protein n=1 Tax=marine sediment metagenome TaxID=412755 RepID=A0A0F9KSX0_9ZZZZ